MLILKGRFFNKPLVSEEMVRLYYEPFKKKSVRDTLIMSLLHFEDSTGNSDLRSIRRDTIIFTGDNDDMHPKRDADVLTKKSGAKRVHLRNCGHFVNEEKADKFNSDMLWFLQK